MIMTKGYVYYWEDNKNSSLLIDYVFTSRREIAAVWTSREDAQSDCDLVFNRQDIRIDVASAGKFTCGDFKVDERRPGEFVVYCEAPFAST